MSTINVFLTLFINASAILLYFEILKRRGNVVNEDIMNKKVFDAPYITKNCCSWWPISHLIVFTIYSFVWPQHSVLLFALGVLWELIEAIINWLETEEGEVVQHQRTRNKEGDVEYAKWWSGSFKDIGFNTVGIVLGRMLSKYFA